MKSEGPKIGHLIEGDEERDAIHIAVLPVTAMDYINPGAPIFIGTHGGARPGQNGQAIADPFLKATINRGQKFWAFIYPNTISGLKHNWSHPDINLDLRPSIPPDKKQSVRWMEDLADQYGVTYQWLMDKADGIARGVDDWIIFPRDCHGEINPQEFWKHYEVIRDRFVDSGVDKSEDIFSCSC